MAKINALNNLKQKHKAFAGFSYSSIFFLLEYIEVLNSQKWMISFY